MRGLRSLPRGSHFRSICRSDADYPHRRHPRLYLSCQTSPVRLTRSRRHSEQLATPCFPAYSSASLASVTYPCVASSSFLLCPLLSTCPGSCLLRICGRLRHHRDLASSSLLRRQVMPLSASMGHPRPFASDPRPGGPRRWCRLPASTTR